VHGVSNRWPDTVIVKTDVRNAFNEIRRATFMSKLFTMPALGAIWRIAHWAYASHSALYVIDRGALMETLWSREGVQQGDVLGGLLFCLGCQDNFISSINCAKDVTGVAVMDDFYIQGNYKHVFQPFDRYATESKQDGLILRPDKCIVLWAHPGEPPQPLLDDIKKRGLCLARGAMESLGSIVGLDGPLMSQWLVNQLSSATHNQLFATLLNSSLPVQPAMAILRLSALPKMGYLLRTIKPSITAKAAALFDAKVIETAIANFVSLTTFRLVHIYN